MKNFKIILISLIIILFLVFLAFQFILKEDDKTSSSFKQNTTENQYTIIAFGDSLTAGYGLPLNESYPAQLESKLQTEGYNIKVINAGVSGETSRGNLERAEFIKNQQADMVILGIGGNDALRALSVSEMKNNIEKTIQTLQSGEKKPKILILEMQSPLNAGLKYKNEFDNVYEDLSEKYDLPLVPFLVSSVFLKTELMLPDRIHPNKEGYARLIENYVYKEVIKNLK